MAVKQKSLDNLIKGSRPGWTNLPTKAIRVPQIFADQLLEQARALDRGEDIGHSTTPDLNLEAVEEYISNLEAVATKKIILLAEARLEKLYGKIEDSNDLLLKQFRNWAGESIKPFQRFLDLVEKQDKLTLWQAEALIDIAGEENFALGSNELDEIFPDWDSDADHKLKLWGDEIRLYSPRDPSGKSQAICKSIKGYQFERGRGDCYWSFPIEKTSEVIEKFSEYPFDLSPDIEAYYLLEDYYREQSRLKQLAEQEVQLNRKLEAEQRKQRVQQKLKEEQEAKALAKAEAEQRKQLEKQRLQQEWEAATKELLSLSGYKSPLDNGWELREYQQSGVDFLISNRKGNSDLHGGILADEMGLGKTLTALVAAKGFQQKTGCAVFVICPATLKENWKREAAIAQVQIEVFSSAKIPEPLENKEYVAIFDEAHFYQSLDSQRTKKMLKLASHQNNLAVWLLTGTPIKNGRPANLFPLLKAVNHRLVADQKEFEEKYCNAYFRDVGRKTIWDNTGASHLEELNTNIQDVLLRRTKKECLPDLPDKSNIFVSVQLDSKATKTYKAEIAQFAADYRERVKDGEVDAGAEALATLTAIRRIGSNYKVSAALERLEEIGGSVVIFTEFKESAVHLKSELGKEAVLLTGDTPVEDRQGLVDQFQRGEVRYFIGTIKAGGVGLTLTQSSNVLLVDRPWTPGDTDQAIDRCHRSGQKNAVFAHWLQLGEVDRAIDNLLFEKQDRIKIVLKKKQLHNARNMKDLAKKLLEVL